MHKRYLLIKTDNKEFLVDGDTGEILLESEYCYPLEAERILNYLNLNFAAIDLT